MNINKQTYLVLGIIILIIIASGGAIFLLGQSKKQSSKSSATRPTATPMSQISQVVQPTDIKMTTTVNQLPSSESIALTISAPTDKSTVKNPTVTVKGKTVSGAEIFVNNVETTADSSGNFSANIALDEDDNTITIVANDPYGKHAETEIVVTYQP
jgi:flagellar basal body-associated protein FliL